MAKKNWSISTVATAPSPTTSGTSLVVATGHGARFADDEPAQIFPANEQPDSANGEIVMITNIAGDTLTITREQESTTARDIQVGDIIIQGMTAKDYNDLLTLATHSNRTALDNVSGTNTGDDASIPIVDGSGGTLTGLVNGSNTLFTVSNGAYISGQLKVYRNGVRQNKGASNDWVETTPASGTFTFNTAPLTGDYIEAEYIK